MQAYFDGSGKSCDPSVHYLTLAGYIGSAEAWHFFEENWKEICFRRGLKYLHMQENPSYEVIGDFFNECFSVTGWGKYKNKFLATACTINLDDYKKIRGEIESGSIKEPEAYCVDFVITVSLMSLPENLGKPCGKDGLLYVCFDQNEDFINKMHPYWQTRRKNPKDPLHLIRKLSTANMRDTIGLQAADFLAWQTNRYYSKGFREHSGACSQIIRVLATPLFSQYYDYQYFKKITKDTEQLLSGRAEKIILQKPSPAN
jgi:hypothetical protein